MGNINERHISSCNRRVLVFTTVVTPSPELAQTATRNGWSLQPVSGSGDALRQVVLNEPAAVVVYLDGRDSSAAVVSLVAALRCRRPHLPVIALGESDGDEDDERRVRAAGATAYAAGLESAAQLVTALLSTTTVAIHSGCPPPAAALRVGATRIRGRPRRTRAE